MALTLHYHPLSRAAGSVWALEEVGCEYELAFVDLRAGAHKQADFKKLNTMGKLPTLIDGEALVTEAAAIALYLGDRYSLGELAPATDDPARGTYLRWSFYAPSVIEPGCLAKAANWEFKASSAGWGTYEEMLDTIEAAIGEGPYLLGERFSMADVIFGGTLRWMLGFGMLDKRPAFTAYVERLGERPALKRADAINAEARAQHGLEG
jgi:glutathione S-transferase